METFPMEAPVTEASAIQAVSALELAGMPATLKPGRAIPHRKVLRSWMRAWSTRRTGHALLLLLIDSVLFLAAIGATVVLRATLMKLLAGCAAGFVIGRLFILGHDACHQSFTPHRRLNKLLGRIAFLPSLTPYSLWDVGHNVVHHGYTNLKGVDFVWAPSTLEEFEAFSPPRQWLERLYRSGWAPWLYYLVEIWWLRMYFPSRRYVQVRRAVFLRDGWLVTAFAALWIACLVLAAQATAQSVFALLGFGFMLPFLFWNGMIGFVVYVHHTHVRVNWHADKVRWGAAQPFVSTTVHLTFRFGIGAVLHHIMEHTAHHVDMGIPLYHLKPAQQALEDHLPGVIIVQPFSWRWYFDTAKRCKLYDLDRASWTDFAGAPTVQAAVGP